MTLNKNLKKVSSLGLRQFLLDLKPLSKINSICEFLFIKGNNIMYCVYSSAIPQCIIGQQFPNSNICRILKWGIKNRYNLYLY